MGFMTLEKNMSTIAIYPGTFDPITKGHVDLIERSLKMFNQVIVAIAKNARKTPTFSLEQRVALVQKVLAKHVDVKVYPFCGLLVDFAKEKQAQVIIRGLRAISDFEYELQLADINRHLNPSFETVFMVPSERYAYISSSMVREIASLGGDITEFVPPEVRQVLQEHYSCP